MVATLFPVGADFDGTGLLPLGDVEIEYSYLPAQGEGEGEPALVFLHEGLGSAQLWRAFPERIREELRLPPCLIYSRLGYGKSTPVRGNRPIDYMHREALEILPAILEAFGIVNPVLIGHSDGASIVLIHAGAGFGVSSLVLMAPHVFTEERSLQGIKAVREMFMTTDFPERFSRHHIDADATFWSWNDAWLSAEFASWNIEEYLPRIDVPVLVIQGDRDEYGTLAQLAAISASVKGPVETVVIADCGHAPHFEHPQRVVGAVCGFLGNGAL